MARNLVNRYALLLWVSGDRDGGMRLSLGRAGQ